MRRLLAMAAAALMALPLLAAEPAQPTCAYEELEERPWGTVRPLPPRADDRAVGSNVDDFVGFAIGQNQGSQAAVVDSRSLQVTRDAGCTWDEALTLSSEVDLASDLQESSAVFMDVAMSDRESGDERIVALVYDLDYGGAVRVQTMVSADGGRTFELGGRGLPTALPVGVEWVRCDHAMGCAIEIAPSDPNVVYVRLSTWPDTEFYRSGDGGLTFKRMNAVLGGVGETEGRSPADPLALAIDHDDADTIWATSFGSSVLSTTNGGRSWTEHELADAVAFIGTVGEVVDIAMTPGPPGDLPYILAVLDVTTSEGSQEATVVTGDNGRTWTASTSDMRGNVTDVAGGATPGLFLATSDAGAHQFDAATGTWRWLDGSSLGPLHDVQPIHGSETTWFLGPTVLPVLGDLGFVTLPIVPEVGFEVGAFDPLNPLGALPGKFDWPNKVVRLAVGQSAVVDMTFDLPQNQTALDVFFLFDQSGSMQEEMDALARKMADVTRELTRRRIDLNVGLGGYSGGWRYQLHKDIGPPSDPAFRRALESLRAGGGYETAYTALHQIATGTGLPDSLAGFGPPEGWNAHWRPGAVRVVVHLTDEPLQAEDRPSANEAIEALQAHQIRVIGLVSGNRVDVDTSQSVAASVDSPIREGDASYGPVATLARLTNALAGSSGVDCGGDGEIDIRVGEPIACYLSALQVTETIEDTPVVGNLAEVMVEILEGVTERHDIDFDFDATGIIRGITALDPTAQLDIRQPQNIRIQVDVACDQARSGKVHDPLVVALSASRHLAAARLAVACGPVAITPLAAVAAVAPAAPQPAAAAAAPAPPPPAPVQAPAPAQGVAQAANPATAQALTPQVGMAAAAQQQRQSQAASIGPSGPAAGEDGTEFAFTSLPTRPDPGPGVVLAGAVMASAVGAVTLRRRQAAGRPVTASVRHHR